MAHNEAPQTKFNVQLIEIDEYTTDPITKSLSGALFLSGGVLHFQGDSTLTQVAPA